MAADEERLAQISKRVIKEQMERLGPPNQASILMAKEALEGYYGNPENQKKIEGYYTLQSFILSNLDMFKEIDKYISIINDDYSKYRSLTLNASRTE